MDIRYVDEVYPLYLCVDKKKFMQHLHNIVKESKDFVAIQETDNTVATIYLENNVKFAILYATFEGMEEMGKRLEKLGFSQFMKVTNKPLRLKEKMPVYADYRDSPVFKEWLKKRTKEYNDIIKLSRDSLDKITDTIRPLIEQKKILISDFTDGDKLPFPKMTLVIGNDRPVTNYVYQKETKKLFVEQHDRTKEENLLKVVHEIGTINDSEKELLFESKTIYKNSVVSDDVYFKSPMPSHEGSTYISITLWLFFCINYFVRTLPTCYVKNTKRVNETYVEGKGIYKKTKSKIVLKNEYILNLTKYSTTHIRHIFKCLCWGVRGHYRHYKNGQTIFIQPYRKGKERNNLNAFKEKNYILEGENHNEL